MWEIEAVYNWFLKFLVWLLGRLYFHSQKGWCHRPFEVRPILVSLLRSDQQESKLKPKVKWRPPFLISHFQKLALKLYHKIYQRRNIDKHRKYDSVDVRRPMHTIKIWLLWLEFKIKCISYFLTIPYVIEQLASRRIKLIDLYDSLWTSPEHSSTSAFRYSSSRLCEREKSGDEKWSTMYSLFYRLPLEWVVETYSMSGDLRVTHR